MLFLGLGWEPAQEQVPLPLGHAPAVSCPMGIELTHTNVFCRWCENQFKINQLDLLQVLDCNTSFWWTESDMTENASGRHLKFNIYGKFPPRENSIFVIMLRSFRWASLEDLLRMPERVWNAPCCFNLKTAFQRLLLPMIKLNAYLGREHCTMQKKERKEERKLVGWAAPRPPSLALVA